MCRMSPARGVCSPVAMRSIRSLPRTTLRRSAASSSFPATGATSSSSACTAWARRCTRGWSAPRRAGSRAGCTRRSAAIRTFCRTWSAACSRTAPTPRSSIASSMRTCRSRRWSRTPPPAWRASSPSAIPGSRCPPSCMAPSGAIRTASICAIRRRWIVWPGSWIGLSSPASRRGPASRAGGARRARCSTRPIARAPSAA